MKNYVKRTIILLLSHPVIKKNTGYLFDLKYYCGIAELVSDSAKDLIENVKKLKTLAYAADTKENFLECETALFHALIAEILSSILKTALQSLITYKYVELLWNFVSKMNSILFVRWLI